MYPLPKVEYDSAQLACENSQKLTCHTYTISYNAIHQIIHDQKHTLRIAPMQTNIVLNILIVCNVPMKTMETPRVESCNHFY